MNQDIQEILIEELELVSGSVLEIDPPTAQAIDYPQVVNNPPG